MMSVLKRALPFVVTLIMGVFLGSLFAPAVKRYEWGPGRGYSYGNGTGYRHNKCSQQKYIRESYLTKQEIEISSPVIIFKPSATYTEFARRNDFEGSVKLLVEFRKDGKVGDIKVLESQPYGLTDEAIEAAKDIRFNPAMKNGEAVTTMRVEEYHFPVTAKF